MHLKLENLQRAGSFKIRGAYTRISRLSQEERARGVVAASAGNHAQGVALAAQLLGIHATVYMPTGAPIPKVLATRGYGAEVVFHGHTVDECLVAARAHAGRTGAVLIHPFDHVDVVAGQGTCGLEILEQCPDVRTVLVCTGGGGLLAGIATAIKATHPHVRVVGVQAAAAAAFPPSLAVGRPVPLEEMRTMADGIAVGCPGEVPFELVRALVDDVVTVDEDLLARAMLFLLERAKQVAEPAGAAGVAALLDNPHDFEPPVVAVVSGGNIDPLLMMQVLRHGMLAAGRYLQFRVRVADRPGSLAGLVAVLAETGANVLRGGAQPHRPAARGRRGGDRRPARDQGTRPRRRGDRAPAQGGLPRTAALTRRQRIDTSDRVTSGGGPRPRVTSTAPNRRTSPPSMAHSDARARRPCSGSAPVASQPVDPAAVQHRCAQPRRGRAGRPVARWWRRPSSSSSSSSWWPTGSPPSGWRPCWCRQSWWRSCASSWCPGPRWCCRSSSCPPTVRGSSTADGSRCSCRWRSVSGRSSPRRSRGARSGSPCSGGSWRCCWGSSAPGAPAWSASSGGPVCWRPARRASCSGASRTSPGRSRPGSTCRRCRPRLIEEASRAGAGPRIDRAAVLVRVDEHSVTPVALHGVDRLPWRDPVTAPGTPHDAWRRGEPVHSVRDPDRDGRRQGSAMLAIPLADRDDELLGLLVLERLVPQPMSPSEIEHVLSVCRRMAPQLHAALAFTELRHVSEVAERERLAREMHDGVAQDLSALGFAVDVAIKHVRERDDEAAQVLRDVRADLSRTIGDIRSSIADLRSSPRPERGLGAALSSHLQALGSTGALSVTTSLRESPFRLAAHVESVLLRLALDLVSHTRTDGTATALVTELATHPPRASLRMERTGGGSWVPDDTLVRALRSLGGDLVVVEEATRLVMRVEVGGRPFAPHAIIEDRGTIDVAGLEGSARRGRSDARLLGEEAVP